MDLEAFIGHWRLERHILDRLAGSRARFEGQADFRRAAHGLILDEAGELRLGGGRPLRATRRYLWSAAGGLIEVRFDDGRFFHAFDPVQPEPSAHHACAPDSYRVTYGLSDPLCWTSRWDIHGPRKNQVIRSTYRR